MQTKQLSVGGTKAELMARVVDRKLAEPPSNFTAGRPKAALLFCLLLVVLYAFFQTCYTAAISIVFICLEYDSSIVPTCPSIPAARFAFRLCFIHFVLLLFGVVYSV